MRTVVELADGDEARLVAVAQDAAQLGIARLPAAADLRHLDHVAGADWPNTRAGTIIGNPMPPASDAFKNCRRERSGECVSEFIASPYSLPIAHWIPPRIWLYRIGLA